MKSIARSLVVVWLCSLFCATALAQPMRVDDVPAPLRPWIPWAMHGVQANPCAKQGDEFVCQWISEVSLSMRPNGGTFVLNVVSENESTVILPGQGASFPQHVRVDGHPVVVLHSGEFAEVRVVAGRHRIEGDFVWSQRPETIPMPSGIAIVRLTLDGRVVENVRRDEEGGVWLERRAADASSEEENRESVEVFRRVMDGTPVEITTQIHLQIGGRVRELPLGRVTLANSTPVEASASLPMRLSADGTLIVQASPGTHVITIKEILSSGSTVFAAPAQNTPWPPVETWAVQLNETLRQTTVTGAPAIDAARTNLPAEWRSLPAYNVTRGSSLSFEVSRRGEDTPPTNRLSLNRELWIDFSGKGVTARDRINGEMHRDWRLDFLGAGLGSMSVNSEGQTITRGRQGTGAELRSANVSVEADWRKEGDISTLPIVGWSQEMQDVTANLHLPPGWRLLAASGVDTANGSWIKEWTLWGVFFVLLIGIAFGRTFGYAAGALALVTLTLCYHESGAPIALWLVLAVALLLHRELSQKILKRVMFFIWGASFLAIVIQCAMFSVERARFAVHPQGGSHGVGMMDGFAEGGVGTRNMYAPAAPPPVDTLAAEEIAQPLAAQATIPAAREQDVDRRRSESLRSASVSSANLRGGVLGVLANNYLAKMNDPNAIVQTGPGVPTWSWQTISLQWHQGAVRKDETFSLTLLSPAVTRSLAVLEIALLLLLAAIVWRARPKLPAGKGDADSSSNLTSAAPAAALLLAVACFAVPAHAQEIPSNETLQELRNRLSPAAPACNGACAIITNIDVGVRGNALSLDMEVHAQALSAVALPGPLSTWTPSRVTLDGLADVGLGVDGEDYLIARVPQGVHRVHVEGSLAGRTTLTLNLPESVPHASVTAEGWQVAGIEDDEPADTLSFTRLDTQAASSTTESNTNEPSSENPQLPSWIVFERTIHLGVQWMIENHVRRIGSYAAPISFRIPKLAGESITSADVSSDRSGVLVALGPGESEKSWESHLDIASVLALTAERGVMRSESWRVDCGALWSCAYGGVPPTQHEYEGNALPTFNPWPGETLNVAVGRPVASPGATRTIEHADLNVSLGSRMKESTLTMMVHATAAGSLAISVPHNAEVLELKVADQTRPIQRSGDRVIVSLSPQRAQIVVRWREPFSWSLFASTPKVQVDTQSVDVNLQISLPHDRWLLWTNGPAWGAHVFFWGYFALIMVFAVLLSRVRSAEMSVLDWMLLAIGLATTSFGVAIVVVGWFLLFAYRRTRVQVGVAEFNLRQIFLVFYTLIAVVCLGMAVHAGLLLDPDMMIEGDPRNLSFYVDRTTGAFPVASVLTLPMWAYRLVMLVWSLWLAIRVVKWARGAWRAFFLGGGWMAIPKPAPIAPAAPAAPVAEVAVEQPTQPNAVIAEEPENKG